MFESESVLSDQFPRNLFDCDSQDLPPLLSIDEVGRGCLAGPVYVCVSLWIPQKEKKTDITWLKLVHDSKKLTPQARRFCFDEIAKAFQLKIDQIPLTDKGLNHPDQLCSAHRTIRMGNEEFLKIKKQSPKSPNGFYRCLDFCLGACHAEEVDRFRIWNAVQLAAGRALMILHEKHGLPTLSQAVILMDGKTFIRVPDIFQNHRQAAVVEADALFLSVGFSSIIAKVCRDHFMEMQDFLYPQYGFFSHKGYGTQEHFEKIKKHGLCSLHRKSFCHS